MRYYPNKEFQFYMKVSSTYINGMKCKYPYEMSKDNVWHYLLNLALVRKLVDDPTLNKMSRDISYRLVKYMHAKAIHRYSNPNLWDWFN